MQIWDYISSELVHNITYAHRLPPTFIEQARGLANLRENAIFSDASMDGIGNSKSTSSIALVSVSLIPLVVASRTALSSVISALQRIAFNGDPLQLMLIQTTYQPFISLFAQTEAAKHYPELAAIRKCPVLSRSLLVLTQTSRLWFCPRC